MYLLYLSLGSIPFKIVPLCSVTSIPALLPLLDRALEVLFSKRIQQHSAIPSGSPPLCQSGYPLTAVSSSGRGSSRTGPNLVIKADAEV
jgi:hypothetical protein